MYLTTRVLLINCKCKCKIDIQLFLTNSPCSHLFFCYYQATITLQYTYESSEDYYFYPCNVPQCQLQTLSKRNEAIPDQHQHQRWHVLSHCLQLYLQQQKGPLPEHIKVFSSEILKSNEFLDARENEFRIQNLLV